MRHATKATLSAFGGELIAKQSSLTITSPLFQVFWSYRNLHEHRLVSEATEVMDYSNLNVSLTYLKVLRVG